MQAEPEQPFRLPQERRWRARLSWRILPAFYATGLAGGGVAWLSASSTVAMTMGVLAVIVAWVWVVYRAWRSCVVLTSTSSVADTVVVQGWFVDRRIPVDQIMEVVSSSRYGPQIRTIDGRKIRFIPLSQGLTSKSGAPQREVVKALNCAVRAAHAAHPEGNAAAVQANAPLRARRELRDPLVGTAIGLGILFSGLIPPRRSHYIPGDVVGGLFVVLNLGVLCLELYTPKGRGRHSRH